MVLLALNKSLQEQVQQCNSCNRLRNRKLKDDDEYVPHGSPSKNIKKKLLSPRSKVRRWLQFGMTALQPNLDLQVL